MCTNSYYIYNKYARKRLFVPCGHCPACLQQKASLRASRIRNHSQPDVICYFVTLTYDNKYIPYVKIDDLIRLQNDWTMGPLPVYRDYDVRKSKNGFFFEYSNFSPVSFLDFDDLRNVSQCSYFPQLTKKPGMMGIALYSDLQKFFKRLRVNLERFYGIKDSISYYGCSEYGSKTKRPHFHCLIYASRHIKDVLFSAIVQSWPYGDMLRTDKRIQLSKDAASYVASYVNSASSLPAILKTRFIRQKHSYSKHFGLGLSDFSLDSILQKVERRNLSYTKRVITDGVPVLASFPVPKYVINRYFPKFKGYFRYSDLEIYELLRLPRLFGFFPEFWDVVRPWLEHPDLFPAPPLYTYDFRYTQEDVERFVVRISNCFKNYHAATGNTIYDYAIDFTRTWNCYKSYVLRESYRNELDFSDFYENIGEVDFLSRDGTLRAPTLNRGVMYQTDPNRRLDVVVTTKHFHDLFLKRDKMFKLNNLVLSSQYDDF